MSPGLFFITASLFIKDNTQKVKLLECTKCILLSSSLLCFLNLVVDEQNAHTEDTELPSALELRKDSEEENRDSEKDEDTREVEAVPCECAVLRPACETSLLARP